MLSSSLPFFPIIRWRVKVGDSMCIQKAHIHYIVQVTGKLTALKGLDARLKEIRGYLDLVIEGKLPLNHDLN